MASELKPCPFCGGKASIERKGDRSMSTIYSCDWCGCSLETGEEWDHGKAWNTRPAPAATDTGLVTVAWQHQDYDEWHETRVPEYHKNRGKNVRELVTRSQAEELLAAEIRRERDLAEKQLSEVVDRMSDDYLALKAELDQAVGVIEDRSSEYEALEAKLTAAEKALKSARPYVEDYDTRRHNTGVDETLTQIDAALGGKPL